MTSYIPLRGGTAGLRPRWRPHPPTPRPQLPRTADRRPRGHLVSRPVPRHGPPRLHQPHLRTRTRRTSRPVGPVLRQRSRPARRSTAVPGTSDARRHCPGSDPPARRGALVSPWQADHTRAGAWLEHRGGALRSRNRYFNALHAFYIWAVSEGLCRHNPFDEHLRPNLRDKPGLPVIDATHMTALMQAADGLYAPTPLVYDGDDQDEQSEVKAASAESAGNTRRTPRSGSEMT